jgi:hypothetical protein
VVSKRLSSWTHISNSSYASQQFTSLTPKSSLGKSFRSNWAKPNIQVKTSLPAQNKHNQDFTNYFKTPSSKTTLLSQPTHAIQSRRGVAKVKAPMGRGMRLKIFLATPGQIADPYVPEKSKSIFTKAGLAQRWRRMKIFLQTLYSMRRTNKLLSTNLSEKFSKKAFLEEVTEKYRQFNDALLKRDTNAIKDLTTPIYSSVSKLLLKKLCIN